MIDLTLTELEEDLRRRPQDADRWEELAGHYARLGRAREELELLLEALGHHPDRRGLVRRARRALRREEGVIGDHRLEHDGYLRDLAFSPDGKLLATAGDDGVVRLWTVRTGLPVRELTGHRAPVRSVRFSPDGRQLLTGSQDRTARLHDLTGEAGARVLRGHTRAVLCARFSPDGNRILTSSSDTTCRIWDRESGEERLRLEGSLFPVPTCEFSPDGTRVLSGSLSRTSTLWDAHDGTPLLHLHGHQGWVRCGDFSPAGDRVVSGSQDGTCRLWDAASGQERMRLGRAAAGGAVRSCGFSPGGEELALGLEDGTVRLLDAQRGEERLALEAQGGPVHACRFSPDGRRLAVGGADGTARLLRVEDGADLLPRLGARAAVAACFFMPDGGELVAASRDHRLRIHAVADGEELQSLTFPALAIRCGAVSAAGGLVAVGGAEHLGPLRTGSRGACHLWFPDRPLVDVVLEEEQQGVVCLALSADGSRLVTGSEDRRVVVWDTATATVVTSLTGHQSPPLAVALSPDGRRVATSTREQRVRLYDLVDAGSPAAELPIDAAADALQFLSPAGLRRDGGERLVAGCRDGALRVLSPDGRRMLRSRALDPAGAVLSLAARGPWLLAGTDTGGVTLRDAETLAELQRFPASVRARSVALSPDLRVAAWTQGCHLRIARIEVGHDG